MDRDPGGIWPQHARTVGILITALMVVIASCGDDADEAVTTDAATTSPVTTAAEAPATTDAATTAPATTAATVPPPEPPPVPDPLDVSVETETDAAAKAFIPTEGGSVSAVAADGTRLTLSIPADALLSPQEITVTPVGAVAGLPLSEGLSAGADLDPEGLQLQTPATLTIEPAGGAPDGIPVGFAYQEDGAEFHLFPMDFAGDAITVQLSHFSGYGAGGATDADIAAQLQRVPTSPAAQANQAIAGVIAQSGATAGQSLPAAAQGSVEDTLRDWWEQSVKPRLENAQADAVQLDDAVTEYLDWWAAVQTAILTGSFVNEDLEARDLLTTGLANGIEEFSLPCLQQAVPENVIFIARWWNVAVNLGLQIGYTRQEIEAIITACAVFVLDFDSSITLAAGPVSGTFEVTATVPLILDSSLDYLTGAGPLTYTNVDFLFPPLPPNCAVTNVQGTGSTLSVPFAWLNLDILAGPPDLRVVIDPGRPSESLTATCTDPDSGRTFTDTLEFDGWVGNFAAVHVGEFYVDPGGAESGIRITGFSSTGPMSFVKTFDQQASNAGTVVDELTTIEVAPG